MSYDTHWFCQALGVWTPARPSLNRLTTAFAIVTYPLSDFSQLQGLDQALSPGWEPGHSLGFVPFSAITISTRRMKLPLQTLPAHRFSQPFSRFHDVDHGSRVYSTPLALVGLRPSKFYLRTIENCFQSPCFYVVACPTWIPSLFRCAIPLDSPQRITRTCDVHETRPTDFRRNRLPSQASANLEALLPP